MNTEQITRRTYSATSHITATGYFGPAALDGEELATVVFYYMNGGEHLPDDEDPTEYMTEQYLAVAKLKVGQSHDLAAATFTRTA